MTDFYARGLPPEHQEADDVVGHSTGQQQAPLVWELRRLQKFLDQERQERARFPRAVDLQSTNWPSTGAHKQKNSAHETVDSPVNRLLDKFGLSRRKLEKRPRPRRNAPAIARPSGRQCAAVIAEVRPVEKTERSPCRSKTHDKRELHKSNRHPGRKLSVVPAVDHVGHVSPQRGGRRRSLFALAWQFVRRRLFSRAAPAYGFLAGQTDAGALEDSEKELTVRLVRAYEGELKTGLRILIIGVGIVGGWATLVPLSGAVIVPGTLVVESDVKKIQHPAGGVVSNIPVRDGMHVRAGDLLLHLDETQPRANAQVVTQQLGQIRVRLARLVAERDGFEPQMPHEMADPESTNDQNRLWSSEISLFNSRAAARNSAKELLQSRIAQLHEQISGLDAQVKSKASQHELIAGELQGVDSLYQKGLVPLTRKTSLQRESARLDGERGQATAAIAEAKSKISETQLQIIRIDQDFRTEVMKDLREAQDKEAELVEKTIAARDLLARVDLRAPTNGIVHQLAVHTIGGVITPGEVIMEIVPESDELQIEARLPPQEIDHVRAGQRASIRFPAFNQRTTPQLDGIVSFVSADLSHDRQRNSNAAYYTVRVTLPASERRRLGGLQLVSGMPAEVFLQTESRTMMSYLLKPITDQLLRTFN
jgi:HlyD family secretion protein